jgi:hypothetical protein
VRDYGQVFEGALALVTGPDEHASGPL